MTRSVKNGVEVFVPSGSTALHELCRKGDLDRLRRYVGDCPRIAQHELMARNEDGDVPIVKAFWKGGADMVKFILDRAGSDSDRFEMLSLRNILGDTPLIMAARYADKDVIELLLQSVGSDEKRQALKEQKNNYGGNAVTSTFSVEKPYEVIKLVSPTPDPVGEFRSRTIGQLRRHEVDDLIGAYSLYYKTFQSDLEKIYLNTIKEILRPDDDEENDSYWADKKNWLFDFRMYMWYDYMVVL